VVTDNEISYSAFISYANPDKAKAFEIAETLEQRGFRCWIAPRDVRAGQLYPDEIIRGIEQSRCLILVLSEAANKSVFVAREVERAVSRRKAVFPVRIEEVMPSRGLELLVSTVHWIDAWSGSMSAHMERLARDLQDDDVVEKVANFSEKVRRRGMLPRWMIAAATCLVLLAAIIVGTWLPHRGSIAKNSSATAPQTDPVKEAFRNELAHLGVNFGSITKNDIRPYMTGKISFPKIQLEMDGKLKQALMKYTALCFASGDGPFKKTPGFDFISAYVETESVDQYSIAVSDLLRNNSLNIKFELNYSATHQQGTIGPFTYAFDYRKEMLKAIKQSALNQNHWASWLRGLIRWQQLASARPPPLGSGGSWHLNVLRECYPAIKRVYVGTQPVNLRLAKTLPDPPSFDDRQAIMHEDLDNQSAHLTESLPVPDNAAAIYVQLEFFDGSKSDVREQRRNN
jgi:hypothetical protein